MDSGWYVILFTILGGIFGAAITALYISCKEDAKESNEMVIGTRTENILMVNNILLKISLWKMIIDFCPTNENGYYYHGTDGYIAEAFARLGIVNDTVDKKIAEDKIERLENRLININKKM